MDFVVNQGAVNSKIFPLQLPSRVEMAKHLMPANAFPTLQALTPGTLVRAVVDSVVRNGLCVTFGGGVFRGAIEIDHLGSYWVPKQRSESTEWKAVFNRHRSIVARIIAVDAATKIIRLSMIPHILDQKLPPKLPEVGTIVRNATVLRIDHGIGVLLALPQSSDEALLRKRLHSPVSKDDEYLEASRIQAVYVHIVKALDSHKGRVENAEFVKEFAPSTKHSVRILSAANMIEGIASGGASESILSAQVLTHSDLVPGKIYRQVPICAQLECGGVLVDFGMEIRGMVPAMHLGEKKSNRGAPTVGSKIDVRVLTVDPATKRCMLTAKKTLVKTDEVISSFEGLTIGQRGTGFVSSIDDRGLVVTFFNGVYGRVPARSLKLGLGIESHRDSYRVGDVVSGLISSLKNVGSTGHNFWEITFRLQAKGAEDSTLESEQRMVTLRVGTLLPSKALRVLELVNGRQKEKHFVSGYAIVGAKTKYLFDETECSTLMPEFECKLPYDQLFDNYDAEDVQSAAKLDDLACQALAVGRKLNGKAIVLRAPTKSRLEYFNGTGTLPVVSLRPSLVKCFEQTGQDDSDSGSQMVPSPTSRIVVGAKVTGYVARVDPRYGAFVQFLDGLSGLVPKKKGGLDLPALMSISCRVVAVDTTSKPMKLLVEPVEPISKQLSISRQIDTEVVTNANRKPADDKTSTAGIKTGAKVCCVVSSVAHPNKGLNIVAETGERGFLDALEISNDINKLEALEETFPKGSRLECYVLSAPQAKGEVLLLSLLSKSGQRWRPAAGELCVGRVNSSLGVPQPPALMVELRGGFTGRCCITELSEPSSWSTFPLGQTDMKGEAR